MIELLPHSTGTSGHLTRSAQWMVPLALGTLGCSVQTETYDQDAESGSVHALVQVRRVEMYDEQPHGDALAAFVRVPPSADTEQFLTLAGLWPTFPDVGQCEIDHPGFSPEGGEFETAELLSARHVEIHTAEGLHDLAPHAFPSAYDLLRGVVYSSRDQLADHLPDNARYEVSGSEIDLGEELLTADVRSEQLSPPFPTDVRVLSQPFDGITEIPPQPVLDFSWQSSNDIRDSIVISVSRSNVVYRCTFEDSEGFGSVPLVLPSGEPLWTDSQEATVAVHRIRIARDTHPQLAQVAVGFDFAVEKTWTMKTMDVEPGLDGDEENSTSDDGTRQAESRVSSGTIFDGEDRSLP